MSTAVFTAVALIAFAANSVLCRLALGESQMDGGSFTAIRLLSGALVLALIVIVRGDGAAPLSTENQARGSWVSSLMLFLYATAFSYAYLTLDTATGALILFGAVQVTMIVWTVVAGDRLHRVEWAGVVMAASGFVYLMLPSATTPSIGGFILMTLAGIAWGLYSLRGLGSTNPLMDTAYNFIRTVPMVALLVLVMVSHMHVSASGVWLAMVSGGIASGIGYAIWYVAIGGLSATQAAVVQLLVPVIAAAGGAIWLSEMVGIRLMIAAMMILGGILMVVAGKYAKGL